MRFLLIIILVLSPQAMYADGWSALLRQADSLIHNGNYEQAEIAYTRAIEKMDTLHRVPAYFEALTNRARCRKHNGLYSESLTDYNCALSLCQRNTLLKAHQSRVILNKSDLLLSTGQYQEAAEDLMPLSVEGDVESETHRLNNLSIALSQTSRASEAIRLLDKTIATSKDSTTQGVALQNKAFINWQQGDKQHAINDFASAISLLGKNENYTLVMVMANRAVLLSEIGKYDEALADINHALSWMKQHYGINHPEYLIVLRKKFEILLRAHDKERALLVAKDYFNAQKNFILKEFPNYTQQRRLNYWKMLKPQISEIFSMEDAVSANLLYDVALYRRAISLLSTAATTTDIHEAMTISEADVRHKLKQGESAVEFVCYRHETTADTIYAAIISLPAHQPIFVKLFNAPQLNNIRINGKTVREAIFSDDAIDKDSLYTSKQLASLVWHSIEQALPKETKTMFFAPDGIFHTLAIEYLPCEELKRQKLYRLTTTAKIAKRDNKKYSNASYAKDALIVGGLDYAHIDNQQELSSSPNHDAAERLLEALPQGDWFERLPFTAIENERIDSLLATSTVCSYMSEKSIKKLMASHQIVHLATHGYSLSADSQPETILMRDSLTEDRSLLSSGIALSGANIAWRDNNHDDEILSAKEISELRLDNLSLIVLSACQTALGTTVDEGPAGIVRGLKKAGAKAIVATLWSVNDESAMLFMTAFYKQLAEGKPPHEAFSAARMSLQQYTTRQKQRRRFNPSRMINEIITLDPPIEKHPYESPSFSNPYILIDAI